MKKRVFSIMMLLSISIIANAQYPAWVVDSISLAPTYANDTYYSLKNGTSKVESNKNWHLGFSMSAADSSAIWANHNGGNNFVKVFNTTKDSTQWATVTLADTATSTVCFNNDRGWYQGAFNDIQGSNAFDFGWGTYNPVDHSVNGTTIFIVRANGIYYKVFFSKLESLIMKYSFKVGDFSGNTTTHVVEKTPNYSTNLFAYFNLATLADTNREPNINDWDLQFTRYTTNAVGSGQNTNNNVVGVLKNRRVDVARAEQLHLDTAFDQRDAFIGVWDPAIAAIGYNWKTFDLGNGTWIVPDSNSYFVKARDTVVYQLDFISFGGQSTGKTVFRKRTIGPLALNDVSQSISEYKFFPIPAENQLNVVLNSKETTLATLQAMDMTGRIVMNQSIKINTGLNAYTIPTQTIPTGNYVLKLAGKNISIAQKIQVKH